MRLILVGPPGAGKGTQAVHLAAHYAIPHISTGDIFRANIKNATELGKRAQAFMDKGELVPDSVTNEMVRDRLGQADTVNGFLFDCNDSDTCYNYLDNLILDKDLRVNIGNNAHNKFLQNYDAKNIPEDIFYILGLN